MYRIIILPIRNKKYNRIICNHFFTFRLYHNILLVYQTQDANYDQFRICHRSPPRSLEAIGIIVKL